MSILIKKDQNGYRNLPSKKEDFQLVIDSVDLSDILEYILIIINTKCAPICYWQCYSIEGVMSKGELQWVIYSYLVESKFLVIENRYFGYNGNTEIYKDKFSYYNVLEADLYNPILNRLVNQKYLIQDSVEPFYYRFGPVYWRSTNLENLIYKNKN